MLMNAELLKGSGLVLQARAVLMQHVRKRFDSTVARSGRNQKGVQVSGRYAELRFIARMTESPLCADRTAA